METIHPKVVKNISKEQQKSNEKQFEMIKITKARAVDMTRREIQKCDVQVKMKNIAKDELNKTIAMFTKHLSEGWKAKCPKCEEVFSDYNDPEIRLQKEMKIKEMKHNLELRDMEIEWYKQDKKFFEQELEVAKKYNDIDD